MAYPSGHMVLQWQGAFVVGDSNAVTDTFSGTMRFGAEGGITAAEMLPYDTDDAMDDIVSDLVAFWTRPASFIPPRMLLQQVKWNRVDEEGRYVSQDSTRVRTGINTPGVVGAIAYPTFIAIASTYTTSAERGLASKGRTFWPTNVPISTSDFQLTVDTAATFAGSVAQLISDLGNWPGSDVGRLKPVVASERRGGAMREITGIRIGRTLDTQRRRKNDKDENYVNMNVPS